MKDINFANNFQFTSTSCSFVTLLPFLGFMVPCLLPSYLICSSSGNGEPLLNFQILPRSFFKPLGILSMLEKKLKPTIVGKVKTKSSCLAEAQMFCFKCSCDVPDKYDIVYKHNVNAKGTKFENRCKVKHQ